MPFISSANPDFERIPAPGAPSYRHGADARDGFIPLAFQVTSPYRPDHVLLPHALVMHVNPASFQETFNKKIERIQTRGGFVEQHWGDDLTDISADASTGAFVNLHTGLSSVIRQRTIAWDRYRDLYDLYRHNASVYDPYGAIVLQGQIMLMYDRGTYLGTFRKFDVEESDDSPFAFKISWSFRAEKVLYQVPVNGFNPGVRSPSFQRRNQLNAQNLQGAPPGETNAAGNARREAESKQAAENAKLQEQAAAQKAKYVEQPRINPHDGPRFGPPSGGTGIV